MSTFAITTAVQGIFPDGLGQSILLTNKGPYTIYLDSNTAVSQYTGIPLPPTGSLVWDAARPLFVVGAGPAELQTTINGQAVDASRARTYNLLTRVVDTGMPIQTDLLETGSYDTLVVDCQYTNATALAVGQYVSCGVVWEDEFGISYETEQFAVWYDNSNQRARFFIPVRGPRVTVSVSSDQFATMTAATLRVYGTSRQLPTLCMGFNQQDHMKWPSGGAADSWSPSHLHFVDYDYSTLYLDPLGSRMQLCVSINNSVTTAGRLFVRDGMTGSSTAFMGELPLPIVTGSNRQMGEFIVPVTAPIFITGNAPVVTGGAVTCGLSIIWDDTRI